MKDYMQMYADWCTRRMSASGRALAKLAPKIKQLEPRKMKGTLGSGPRDADLVREITDEADVELHAIRMTARHRLTLNGTDAQALEHALTTVEVERDLLTDELDYYYRTPTERTTVTTPPKDYAPDRPSMVANKVQRRTVPPGT